MYIRYGHAQTRVRRGTASGGGAYFHIVSCYLLKMEWNERCFCIRFRERDRDRVRVTVGVTVRVTVTVRETERKIERVGRNS